MKSKTALICGCTKGIGYATAKLFAEKGCNLILFARNEAALLKTKETLSHENKISIDYIVADFENSDAVAASVDGFFHNTNICIDVLINNVGGDGTGTLKNSSYRRILTTFNRHIVASHIISMAVIDNMKKHNISGKIINVCSNTAISPYPNLGLYAIRSAEIGYMKTLAMELVEDGISVNNILPGAVDTPGLAKLISELASKDGVSHEVKRNDIINQLPLRRLAEANEIAKTVWFLASDENSYMTGSCIKVDGGFSFSTL